MTDRSLPYSVAARALVGIAVVAALGGFAAGSWVGQETIPATPIVVYGDHQPVITFTATPGAKRGPDCGQEITP